MRGGWGGMLCQKRPRLSRKVGECKPLPLARHDDGEGAPLAAPRAARLLPHRRNCCIFLATS